MKKRLLAAVLAATTVLLSACGSGSSASNASGNGGADHLAKIKSAGKIVVGLEGDWQPFSYHDKEHNEIQH